MSAVYDVIEEETVDIVFKHNVKGITNISHPIRGVVTAEAYGTAGENNNILIILL